MASQPPERQTHRDTVPPTACPEDELRLIAAVLQRDRKAAAEFVSRYVDGIYAYVRHRLAPRHDLVDDLVQDVFLAALSGLPRFTGASPLRAWLRGIARHKVEDYYRQRLRDPEPLADGTEPDQLMSETPLFDERIDLARLRRKAQDVMRQLPEPYAVVLLWRYWEGRSVRQMAIATGRTEKGIERLLARARAHFRQLWDRV